MAVNNPSGVVNLPEYDQGYTNNGFVIPQAIAPAPESQLAGPANNGIMNSQLGIASNYRNNLSNTVKKQSDAAYNPYAANSRKQLAKNISSVRSDFNARGLLNSGQRATAETQQGVNTANDLNNYRSQLNSQLYNQDSQTADTLENNALNSAYLYAGVQPNLGANALSSTQGALSQSIANSNYNQQAIGGAAQGLGNFLGRYYANQNSQNNPSYSISNYQGD